MNRRWSVIVCINLDHKVGSLFEFQSRNDLQHYTCPPISDQQQRLLKQEVLCNNQHPVDICTCVEYSKLDI